MDCWDNMPWAKLPKSVMVDLGRYLLKHKNALRFCQNHLSADGFCDLGVPGFFNVFHGMTYIARTASDLALLIGTDNQAFPHEVTLGRILGYPQCCVKKIGVVGESNIDDYNNEFNNKIKKRSLLDISRYSQGIGLISHVPCSTDCKTSQRQAYRFYQSLKTTSGSQKFYLWRDEIINYFEF